MLKSTLTSLMLPLLLLLGSSSDNSAARVKPQSKDIQTETVEKLIVASGSVTMEVNRLNDAGAAEEESKLETLRFALSPDSFFTIVVTNGALRGPLPGSMGLIPQNTANLPAFLSVSLLGAHNAGPGSILFRNWCRKRFRNVVSRSIV